MDGEILKFITAMDTSNYLEFKNGSTTKTDIDIHEEINDYDYTWLNKVEQYLPFLSNITNDTNSYIENKVIKSYENRVIKTLIYQLKDFLYSEEEKFNHINFDNRAKSITNHLTTVVDNETVTIDIKINSSQNTDLEKGTAYGLSVKGRIDRVIELINNLMASNFIKALEDTDIIREKISKTAVFEEEVNYRKAFELYEFLSDYIKKKKVNNKEIYKNNIKSDLMITSFLEYQVLKNCLREDNNDNCYRLFLEKIIEQMVMDCSMDEKAFKKMVTKKFESEYTKKKNREQNIQNIFNRSIDSYNKQIKDALRSLKN